MGSQCLWQCIICSKVVDAKEEEEHKHEDKLKEIQSLLLSLVQLLNFHLNINLESDSPIVRSTRNQKNVTIDKLNTLIKTKLGSDEDNSKYKFCPDCSIELTNFSVLLQQLKSLEQEILGVKYKILGQIKINPYEDITTDRSGDPVELDNKKATPKDIEDPRMPRKLSPKVIQAEDMAPIIVGEDVEIKVEPEDDCLEGPTNLLPLVKLIPIESDPLVQEHYKMRSNIGNQISAQQKKNNNNSATWEGYEDDSQFGVDASIDFDDNWSNQNQPSSNESEFYLSTDDYDDNEKKTNVKRAKMATSRPRSKSKDPKQRTNPTIFKCDHCEKTFKSILTLNKHKSNNHKEENPSLAPAAEEHICDQCGASFAILTYLQRHVKTVHLQKPVQCDVCGITVKGELYLNNHRKLKHSKELGLPTFNCTECPKICPNANTLRQHVKQMHRREYKFKCQHCPYQAFYENRLRHHVLVNHTSEKKYICQTCGKGFQVLCKFTVHMRTHTGEKPFVCKHCGRGFTRLDKMKDHEKTHGPDRPHVCELCGIAYSCKQTLIAHVRTHHVKKGLGVGIRPKKKSKYNNPELEYSDDKQAVSRKTVQHECETEVVKIPINLNDS